MLLTDATGIPISAFTTSAQDAEVNTIETLVDIRVTKKRIPYLLYDKAADADWLRDALEQRGIELVTPHREGRKKPSRQDGRKLRRYRRRWKVERTISEEQKLCSELNAYAYDGTCDGDKYRLKDESKEQCLIRHAIGSMVGAGSQTPEEDLKKMAERLLNDGLAGKPCGDGNRGKGTLGPEQKE